LDAGQISGPITLRIGYADLFSGIINAQSPNPALQAALATGKVYGLYHLDASQSGMSLTLPLNATFIQDLNEALAEGGGAFALGGTILAVPEPATWTMMIFGFGMAGAGLRRRAATAAIA
jgi:hypothetical protein